MDRRPTLRAAFRRGALAATCLVLIGTTPVTQPVIELVAPAAVAVGDTAHVAIRLSNDGPAPLRLELSGRPVDVDLLVGDAGGREVWRWRRGPVGAALMLLTLAPGESRDFRVRWPLTDLGGAKVAPGRYTLQGFIPLGGRRMATRTHELTVTP